MERFRSVSWGIGTICNRNTNNFLPTNMRKLSHPNMEYRTYSIVGAIIVCLLFLLLIFYKLGSIFPGTSSNYLALEDDTYYAVVLDAGSSGTRAYLYSWPSHSGDKHELLKISPLLQDGEPMVKKVSPGLSSMGETPDNAFEYLRPLLLFASENIPQEKHKETPLYILATAGMRLLEKGQQEAVLANLRRGINENFSFYFPTGHLEIISGKQEGIYQWLAINYVLGKFKHAEHAMQNEELVAVEPFHSSRDTESLVFRPRTVGALDMGGASMQVAMEITTNLQLEGMPEKDKAQVAEINLGCTEHDTEHTYRIFVTTFLGYGANEAMNRHQRTIFLETAEMLGIQGLDPEHRVKDPCRPLGMKDNVTLSLDLENLNIDQTIKDKLTEAQTIYFYGTGDWETCFAQLKNFTKTADRFLLCQGSCPDPGMRPPPIQFDNSEFYGFSEFWYSMDDVLGMGGQYMFNKYRKASKDFCSSRWHLSWAKFMQGSYPNSDTERLETQCFKSVWVTVALHEGLTFPLNYGHLSAAPNTVHGQVVHWTLGALLYRTRFFPLRAIAEDGGVHHGTYHSNLSSGYLYSHYIVWLCLLAVSLCIVLYVVRLKKYVKPSTLRKVPSLSYWMPQDEEENLISKEQADYLYSHTKVYVG